METMLFFKETLSKKLGFEPEREHGSGKADRLLKLWGGPFSTANCL
jgi:hypothetical protein